MTELISGFCGFDIWSIWLNGDAVVSQIKIKEAEGGRPPLCAPPFPPRGHRSASRRRADGIVSAVSHSQHVPMPTAAAAWRANMAVSKAAWWPWPFDLESGVRK